jgi:pyridoxine 5-phosphate synthase
MKLGVNIDHVATIRQARYKDFKKVKPWAEPDLLLAAHEARRGGAHSITIHLREDRRHVQDSDLVLLKRRAGLPLNLEMADVPEILRIALKLKPEEVCLVPERRSEVTTEGGLDAASRWKALGRTVRRLEDAGMRTSLFIDPSPRQVEASIRIGASCVELHTGCFANARTPAARRREFEKLRTAAALAREGGLQVNAGHGLNYVNVVWMKRIAGLHTLNIGHSIVSRAVTVGLKRAVSEMRARMG